MKPEQLLLDLSLRPALGRDDLIVSRANARALAMVEGRWPGGRLALTGPAASGKTHLAHVWAAETGAAVVDAADLPRYDIATLASARRVAVEDVDRAAGQARVETALFHLHNRLSAGVGALLVTGREAPARWPIALPDLASRLAALTVAELDPPDDALLGALLEKQFADAGLKVKSEVTMYLVTRMVRSAEAARALATEIDRLAVSRKRKPGIEIANLALAAVASRLSPDRHDPSSEGAT